MVPPLEHLPDLLHRHPGGKAHQLVAFTNQLDISVLDAVVDHLDVVPGAVRSHVGTAGGPVMGFGGDIFQQPLQIAVGFRVSSRHQSRSLQGSLLPAGDSHAEEPDSPLPEFLLSAAGIPVKGISSVHHNVPAVQQRRHHLEHQIHRLPGSDHQ